jgi:hypothetical protein
VATKAAREAAEAEGLVAVTEQGAPRVPYVSTHPVPQAFSLRVGEGWERVVVEPGGDVPDGLDDATLSHCLILGLIGPKPADAGA